MSEANRSGAADEFSTDWIEVRKAGNSATEDGKAALVRLIERYRPSLKAYLCGRFRFEFQEVDDLFQTFIEKRILEDGLISRADEKRGSFRAYLLKALHRFALIEIRQRKCQKRLPRDKMVHLQDVSPDDLPTHIPELKNMAEIAWAQAVIAGALLDMHNELKLTGRVQIWEVFVGRILGPLLRDDPPLEYASLIKHFGFKSPAQALNTLVTAKRIFRRHLTAVIALYTGDGSVVDEELAHLQRVMSRKPGRKPKIT